MANEPDNLVLTILRQIQGTLSDHSQRFDAMDKRFDRLEHKVGDMHESMVTALGLAGHANVQHQSVQTQIEELKDRLLELDEIKARLARLEEKA